MAQKKVYGKEFNSGSKARWKIWNLGSEKKNTSLKEENGFLA